MSKRSMSMLNNQLAFLTSLRPEVPRPRRPSAPRPARIFTAKLGFPGKISAKFSLYSTQSARFPVALHNSSGGPQLRTPERVVKTQAFPLVFRPPMWYTTRGIGGIGSSHQEPYKAFHYTTYKRCCQVPFFLFPRSLSPVPMEPLQKRGGSGPSFSLSSEGRN